MKKRKKVMLALGTRPEAIKLAPVLFELQRRKERFEAVICSTGQHKQMLAQVLDIFKIKPDYELSIMSEGQDLFDITERILRGLKKILSDVKPDIVLVQGDTTTAFAASVAAFYRKIPIGHVEAGLRSYDKYQPYPEEKNRHMISALADINFAPTLQAKRNLIKEGVGSKTIFVTGNTVIDALYFIRERQKNEVAAKEMGGYFWNQCSLRLNGDGSKMILVTGHRRENFGEGFKNICLALKQIARNNPDVAIVYPVHLNPNVRKPVFEILGMKANGTKRYKNIFLLQPLEYPRFVYLMTSSYLILSDSGGVQEEAISLGKPILVTRLVTERSEGIDAGGAVLVGTDCGLIVSKTQQLLNDSDEYRRMASAKNPYGDGRAASRIVDALEQLI